MLRSKKDIAKLLNDREAIDNGSTVIALCIVDGNDYCIEHQRPFSECEVAFKYAKSHVKIVELKQ